MEVDEDDIEQPSSSDNKATKKRFEVKKVKHFLLSTQKTIFYEIGLEIDFLRN